MVTWINKHLNAVGVVRLRPLHVVQAHAVGIVGVGLGGVFETRASAAGVNDHEALEETPPGDAWGVWGYRSTPLCDLWSTHLYPGLGTKASPTSFHNQDTGIKLLRRTPFNVSCVCFFCFVFFADGVKINISTMRALTAWREYNGVNDEKGAHTHMCLGSLPCTTRTCTIADEHQHLELTFRDRTIELAVDEHYHDVLRREPLSRRPALRIVRKHRLDFWRDSLMTAAYTLCRAQHGVIYHTCTAASLSLSSISFARIALAPISSVDDSRP